MDLCLQNSYKLKYLLQQAALITSLTGVTQSLDLRLMIIKRLIYIGFYYIEEGRYFTLKYHKFALKQCSMSKSVEYIKKVIVKKTVHFNGK